MPEKKGQYAEDIVVRGNTRQDNTKAGKRFQNLSKGNAQNNKSALCA